MAGWSDWVKYLVSDGKSTCGTACGIYGPSSAQYQIYATVPDNFHPGLDFFQSIDKILKGGVAACSTITATIPTDSGPKSFKFMILREMDGCVFGKCGSEGGFTVSKTKSLYVVSIYTKSDVQPGNCSKQNAFVQTNLMNRGQ